VSDKETKKPGGRDISDLKARLGLKKDGARGGGLVPPPGAAKLGGGFVPPPPGVAPPRSAEPAIPDARQDPFGAMNAIAAKAAPAAQPEIIVVNQLDKHERVNEKGRGARYAKIAAIILAPLIVGFLLGGINYERRRLNSTIDDAKALNTEFQTIGKDLEQVNVMLLTAKERADGKSFALNDETLITEIENLKFKILDDEKLILYRSNLYNMKPKLVQDTLVFYAKAKSLSAKLQQHVALTKANIGKGTPEARASLDPNNTKSGFGAILRVPTPDEAKNGARPGVEIVQLGLPVCSDNKPIDPSKKETCAAGPPIGLQFRSDVGQTAYSAKEFLPGIELQGDKIVSLRGNGVLEALIKGGGKYADDIGYFQRMEEIDSLTAELIKLRTDIESQMAGLARQGKAFSL
jgi:hypothetical protein